MSTSSSGTSGKDNVFDLGSSAFASDHFRMHEFKVKRCPRARPHDWTQCPFAHPGEKARRRDPRRYRYSGTACPEFRKSGCCRRGDACPFAHGVFECWLHPSRYRTQLCTDGGSCKRRVCFFAHCESELRKPEDDPICTERQVQAELAAGSSNHLTDGIGQQNNIEPIHFTKTSGLPESSNRNGGGGVTTANPFAQEVQVLQQQHLAQALQTIFNAGGVPNTNGGNPSANQSDVALELLKQIASSQAATSVAAPESAGGGNTTALVALLQQLIAQQTNQSDQQQQPQQQAAKTKPASTDPADAPSLPDPSADGAQANAQMALKQILQQQAMPASSTIETPTVSMAAPSKSQFLPGSANGIGVDTSQLAQIDPGVLNGLLEQTSAAKSRTPPAADRHSIDNSFLAAKYLEMSGQVDSDSMAQGSMMMPALSQAQNPQPLAIPNGYTHLPLQPDGRNMFSIGGMHTGHYLTNNLQSMTGTAHGIPLDQNPGLSYQLMQQLDPAILNSLAMRARQAGTMNGSSPGVIDNGLLARLSNVDMSGIVNGVAAQPGNHVSHMIAPGVPIQNGVDMQAGLLQNIQNSLLASQMQGLLHGLGQTEPNGAHFPQMNSVGSYDKNTHHERMGSGNESSLMMPSNMLQ